MAAGAVSLFASKILLLNILAYLMYLSTPHHFLLRIHANCLFNAHFVQNGVGQVPFLLFLLYWAV